MSYEQLEHTEHARHPTHSPFERHVALTIAVVAAVLAAVTVLAHRSHTETLLLQGDAVRLQAEATIAFTKASDTWSLYQSQKIRKHADDAYLKLVDVLPTRPGAANKRADYVAEWQEESDKYAGQLKAWKTEARAYTKESEAKTRASLQQIQHSHVEHDRSFRYDIGELFVEVAVVLCSVAILTKRRSFWYVGMTCCAIGGLVALTGLCNLFIAEPHEPENHAAQHAAVSPHPGTE